MRHWDHYQQHSTSIKVPQLPPPSLFPLSLFSSLFYSIPHSLILPFSTLLQFNFKISLCLSLLISLTFCTCKSVSLRRSPTAYHGSGNRSSRIAFFSLLGFCNQPHASRFFLLAILSYVFSPSRLGLLP